VAPEIAREGEVMTSETLMATDEKKIAWKRDILAWACKRTEGEINSRIDDLISKAISSGLREDVQDRAKYEASELAKIIKRRSS